MTNPAAPATHEQLFARFAELGIVHETQTHVPVFTVEEASALRGALPGIHCKCLFLKSKKGHLVLAVVRAEIRVDLKWLSGEMGLGRFSFANPALLMEKLGVVPGSVTPFGLINDQPPSVLPVLDADMLDGERVHYHPLRNDQTTGVSPADLLKFIAACGHEPRIVRFPALADS